MTDEEKKLAEHLDNLYDVSVVGTEISNDTMRIYLKAKERRCIDKVKCEFTLETSTSFGYACLELEEESSEIPRERTKDKNEENTEERRSRTCHY